MPGDGTPQQQFDQHVFAVCLAAGTSSRFGSSKQLREYRGEALVLRAIRAAEQVCGGRTVLVTGDCGDRVLRACQPLAGFFVHNDRYQDGMGSSIALAAGALSQSAAAILLVLADQPLVTASHLQQLVDTWRSAPDAIVASAYADVVGPPVVFPSRFFRQLTALRGDTGARGVLHANAESVSSIEFNPAAIDIDRPEDLDRLG